MDEPPAPDAWNAAEYARHSSLQQAMARQALALPRLSGDERVLDIGCGDGRVSAMIATRLVPRGSVCGIDASPDMIAFAQRRHADVPNLRFVVADARWPPTAARFDAAVSFNALHWVPDLGRALRALRAALVPQGRAWLRLVTRGPVTSLEAVAEQVRADPAWAARFDGFRDPYLRLDAQEVGALAAGVGLAVVGSRTRLEQWDFGSRAAMLGFCRAGFGAWTRRLPPERRDDFVREVLDRYLDTREDALPTVLRFYQTDLALIAA